MGSIQGNPGISLVGSRNKKKDNVTAGLCVKQDVGGEVIEVDGGWIMQVL